MVFFKVKDMTNLTNKKLSGSAKNKENYKSGNAMLGGGPANFAVLRRV